VKTKNLYITVLSQITRPATLSLKRRSKIPETAPPLLRPWVPVAEMSGIIDTFSIRFFMGNCKPQTAICHVTTALRPLLQFAIHVWTAGRASSRKWFTARFFATKNCTASLLKVWTSFLYLFALFATCLLGFWSRINELLLIFGRLKWYTLTWWKQLVATLNNERVHQIKFNSFLPYSQRKVFCSNPELNFFVYFVAELIT